MNILKQIGYYLRQRDLIVSSQFYHWPGARESVSRQCSWLFLSSTADVDDILTKILEHTTPIGCLCVMQGELQGVLFALSASCSISTQTHLKACLSGLDGGVFQSLPDLSKPGLLVMDMDTTAIETECIDEMAKVYGCEAEVAEITKSAMEGQLSFVQSVQQRLSYFKGMPYEKLEEMAQNLPLRKGLPSFVRRIKRKGWSVILISSGFMPFIEQLVIQAGLDGGCGQALVVDAGKLTGEVEGKIIDAQGKKDAMLRFQKERKIKFPQTIAIGDGANDLLMLEHAGFRIGMHPKPVIAKETDVQIYTNDFQAVSLLMAASIEMYAYFGKVLR